MGEGRHILNAMLQSFSTSDNIHWTCWKLYCQYYTNINLCFENLFKFMIMYLCSAQNSCKFGYCYSSTATVHLNTPTNTPNFKSTCRVLVVTITNLCDLLTLVILSLRRLLHLYASVIVRNSHQFIPICQQVHWPSGILTLELVLVQSTWMVLIAVDMRATSLNVHAIPLLAVPLICTPE